MVATLLVASESNPPILHQFLLHLPHVSLGDEMYQSGKDLVQLLEVWKVEALWAQVVQKVLEESVVEGAE